VREGSDSYTPHGSFHTLAVAPPGCGGHFLGGSACHAFSVGSTGCHLYDIGNVSRLRRVFMYGPR
jgi:hypothetical protein